MKLTDPERKKDFHRLFVEKTLKRKFIHFEKSFKIQFHAQGVLSVYPIHLFSFVQFEPKFELTFQVVLLQSICGTIFRAQTFLVCIFLTIKHLK